MKIALASDLHLEFGDIVLNNTVNADILVLCGDICVAKALKSKTSSKYSRFNEFFEHINKEFPQVIYIMGNHEYYGGKWYETQQVIEQYLSKFENIKFLEGDQFKYKDVTFVGGTLWTSMNNRDPYTLLAIKDMLNDFRLISDETKGYRSIIAEQVVDRHEKTLARFKELVKLDSKVVVCSHHLPTIKSVHTHYVSQKIMNGAYYTELSEFILDNPQILLWMHGHTHTSCDYMLGTTRVVCNPRGYHGYDPQAGEFELKVIEI